MPRDIVNLYNLGAVRHVVCRGQGGYKAKCSIMRRAAPSPAKAYLARNIDNASVDKVS